MRINHQVVVFDAADLAAESSFWAGVLDGTIDSEDDWHMVMVDGEPRVGVQLAPNHVPPDWPDGTPEQQIDLDLWVEDFAATRAGVPEKPAENRRSRLGHQCTDGHEALEQAELPCRPVRGGPGDGLRGSRRGHR